MKVKQLIELLQDEDQEKEVKFSYNYGDYSRTQVAANIRKVEEGEVVYSEYCRMDALADDEDTRERNSVVILF